MDNSSNKIPSLIELNTPVETSTTDVKYQKFEPKGEKIREVFKLLNVIIYPLIVYTAFVVLPQNFSINIIWNILAMLFGFYVYGKIKKVAMPKYPVLEASTSSRSELNPVEKLEDILEQIEEAGYTRAAKDCRVIVRSSQALYAQSSGILNTLDNSFRYYLNNIVKIANIKNILNNEEKFDHHSHRHARRMQKKKGLGGIGIGDFFMGSDKDFEGIRIGSLQIGEGKDFAGIKINGKLIIGETKKASNSENNYSNKKDEDDNIIDAEVIQLPDEYSPLEQAATLACQELNYLRKQCESLLIQSISTDFEKVSQEMRERLDRERRVIEELNSVTSSKLRK